MMYMLVSLAMLIVAIISKDVEFLYASGLFAIADSLSDVARFIKNK